MAPLMKNEKKNPIVAFINRFERNCDTFKGREEKAHCHQHWVNLLEEKIK
jgi:hypothetical protein